MTTDEHYNDDPILNLIAIAHIDRWNQLPERKTMSTEKAVPITNIKPSRLRGERGSGTTITIDLTDQPELLTKIRDAAKADDREPSKWLRRRMIQLADQLFGGGSNAALG